MKKVIIGITLCLMLLIYINAYPQENQNIPFSSLLTVKYQNGYILINFDPLKDQSYNYKIYRSTSALLKTIDLTDKNLIKIIKSSDLPFKDIPEKDGNYYYAVIATKNGHDFKKLIPLQNTLIHPVDFSPAPGIVKINKIVNQEDDKISIYINPVYKSWKYFLFISNKKINNLEKLKPNQIIVGPANNFSIKIKRGLDYFFAVTVQNRLGVKNEKLSPGYNLTIKPFKLKKILQPQVQVKKLPPTEEKKIKKELPKKIKKIKKVPSKNKIKTSTIINRTISLYFLRGKYRRTIQELNWTLKAYPTTGREKSKIYFYLGQSYFYIKNYKKALKYFILCKDFPYYKREADTWIDRILKKIN